MNGPPGEDQLTPEIMSAQPRMTERDVALFIDLFNAILSGGGTERADIAVFALSRGVSMLRLNYGAAKIAFQYVPEANRRAMVEELGLGLLMSADEKAAMRARREELDAIMAELRQGAM